MLFLFILPVTYLMAGTQAQLQTYVPSNRLIGWAQRSVPRRRVVGGMLALSLLLIVGAHGLDVAIRRGAPPWLNLVALVAAWDAIEFACSAVETFLRRLSRSIVTRCSAPGLRCEQVSAAQADRSVTTIPIGGQL